MDERSKSPSRIEFRGEPPRGGGAAVSLLTSLFLSLARLLARRHVRLLADGTRGRKRRGGRNSIHASGRHEAYAGTAASVNSAESNSLKGAALDQL